MEKVYDYLEEKGSPKDFAFEFKLTPVLGNNFSYIKGHRMLFYNPKTHPVLVIKSVKYTQKPPFFYEGNSLQVYYINRINEADYKNRKIFIIRRDKYAVRYYDDVSDQVLFQLLPKKVIGRFAVFELSLSSQNKEREYIRFLHKIKDKTPKKHQSSLLETLLYYSYKRNKRTKFNSLLKEYKEIKSHLPEYSKKPDLKYPVHFDHQRRIKYFENLDWSLRNETHIE